MGIDKARPAVVGLSVFPHPVRIDLKEDPMIVQAAFRAHNTHVFLHRSRFTHDVLC